jgi:YegS/Rv2252/BmrU family lipid kinase
MRDAAASVEREGALAAAQSGGIRQVKGHCIVNPVAGEGMTAKKWARIWQTLCRTGYDLTYEFTAGKGEGTLLAKKAAARGADLILAVGGDGTVNEIVNGLVGSQVRVGIIPTGTGNDFVRTVGIPLDPLEACIVINTMNSKVVDVAKIDDNYFLNVAGIGFDAQVAAEVNRKNSFIKGKLAYLWAIVKVLAVFQPAQIELKFEGSTEVKKNILVVALANARYYGGGMEIAPGAKVDDGLLDVVTIEEMSKPELIKSLPLLLQGSHLKHPKVTVYRCQKLTVTGPETVFVHADGELLTGLPISVELVPKALEIIVPDKSKK